MIEDLGEGVGCIDTGYARTGLAASYVLQDHGEVAIVETGTARALPRILAALDTAGVARESVRYVIPTHVHLDHAGGAGALLAQCPNAELLVHPRGLRHLVDPARLVAGAVEVYGEERFRRLSGAVVPADPARAREAPDGSRWQLGSRELLVRDTPGHARHHFCVWDPGSEGWFTGDTFGIAYPELAFGGRPFLMPTTTPVQFEPEALKRSIALLMAAGPRRMYLTHFGPIAPDAAMAATLCAEIDAFVALARELGDDPGAGERLRKALEDRAITRLGRAGCRWQRAALARLLSIDSDLNAQGLMHWRQTAATGTTPR